MVWCGGLYLQLGLKKNCVWVCVCVGGDTVLGGIVRVKVVDVKICRQLLCQVSQLLH